MVCLRGIVVPAAWDQNGKIISVAIATDDENEYLVETQQTAARLMSLLRQEVEVTGTIIQTKKNDIIRITSYSRPLEGSGKS
ncbi:MAG: hypothetical protein PVH37_17565 [Desulfobacterales bacterium]|jgi:hypothetical protein